MNAQEMDENKNYGHKQKFNRIFEQNKQLLYTKSSFYK